MFKKLFKKHKSKEVTNSPFMIKCMLTDTGEIVEFSYDDNEMFNKMMGNKNAKLILG